MHSADNNRFTLVSNLFYRLHRVHGKFYLQEGGDLECLRSFNSFFGWLQIIGVLNTIITDSALCLVVRRACIVLGMFVDFVR